MSYSGDIRIEDTIDIKFTTVNTSGVPTSLLGSPVISAYIDNGLIQLTAGITLSVDFDGVTGLNNVRIVAIAANGYAAGTNVQLVITTGTVGGRSVVGYVVDSFSIEKRSALMPTTADRRLDVTAAGNAGIDWGNIEASTTVQGLSGTTVKTATDVETDTQDIQSRLPAALVSGRIDSSVGAMATDVITSTAIQNGALTAAKAAAGFFDAVWSVATRTLTSLGASLVQEIWDRATSALTTVGSIGKLLVDNINATISSRLASADITLAAGKVTVGTNDDKTGYAIGIGGIASTAFAASAIDAAALAQDAEREIADEVLDRNIAGGGSGGTRNVRNALRTLRNKVDTSGGTLTVFEEDDATSAWTGTVTRDAAANPIVEIDPT